MLPFYLKNKGEKLFYLTDFNSCHIGKPILSDSLAICFIVNRIIDSGLLHEQS